MTINQHSFCCNIYQWKLFIFHAVWDELFWNIWCKCHIILTWLNNITSATHFHSCHSHSFHLFFTTSNGNNIAWIFFLSQLTNTVQFTQSLYDLTTYRCNIFRCKVFIYNTVLGIYAVNVKHEKKFLCLITVPISI
jgi:hypothetical protein